MCKIWNFKYACDHVLSILLSKCRGSFVFPAKPNSTPKPLCHCTAVFTLRDTYQSCGPCQRAAVEDSLNERLEVLRAEADCETISSSEELAQAEAEYATQLYRLDKLYPSLGFGRKRGGSGKNQRTARVERGSLLRKEVKPEDVVDDWWVDYAAEWASGSSSALTEDECVPESDSEAEQAGEDGQWETDVTQAEAEDAGDDSGYESASDGKEEATVGLRAMRPGCATEIRLAEKMDWCMRTWLSTAA